jgi:hypothetical protein
MCSVASFDDVFAFPVYVGIRYQKGHELGSIFGCLRISAVPLLKRETKTLGREALKAGLNLALDVMEGQNVAPNSHVPHWSESVVLQANPIRISYIRKSLVYWSHF